MLFTASPVTDRYDSDDPYNDCDKYFKTDFDCKHTDNNLIAKIWGI